MTPSSDEQRRAEPDLTTRTRLAVAVMGLIVGGAILAVWLSSRSPREKHRIAARQNAQHAGQSPAAVPTNERYVGSQACAACHAEIAESFSLHPMAQSIGAIDVSNTPEAHLPASSRRVVGKQRILNVDVRGDALVHHERMIDGAGAEIYDQAVTMEYVVGSGRRAKAYLHGRGELLFMSPLNFYTQSQRWDLAPGYVADDRRRFERRVTDECLSCHCGRAAPVGRSLNRFEQPPFHELSIGCENCHGPGAGHIALHESDRSGEKRSDPIVNPAKLDHERRESICNQCHLQAAARVLRPGKGHFDFRPGQRLEDIWTAFDQGTGLGDDGRTRAVSHVQQMRASRCYVQSAGRLGCTSCHEPHRVPAAAEQPAFYRAKCLACHSAGSCSLPEERRLEQDNSCIACHMPALAANNVSHVTQTDHRIVRRMVESPPREKQDGNETLAFFDSADQRLEPWERDRSLGLAVWMHFVKRGRQPPGETVTLLTRALDAHPDDAPVLAALGSIAAQDGRPDRARAWFLAARRDPATEEQALEGLLEVEYAASQRAAALEYADRLLEINPGDARVHALRADILAGVGRRTEGIEAARRALELNPTLVPVRQWLVQACRDAGREPEAAAEEELIRRVRSAQPPH